MKQYLLLLGGFTGFSLAFATGFAAERDIGQILFNSAIGCLVGTLLMQWLADMLIGSLVQQRRAAAIALRNAKRADASASQASKGKPAAPDQFSAQVLSPGQPVKRGQTQSPLSPKNQTAGGAK